MESSAPLCDFMNMTDAIALNPDLDLPSLTAEFARTGRLRIPGFLTDSAAERLHETIQALDWHLVLNDRDRHIDLPVSELPKLGLDRIKAAVLQAQGRAASEFQYVYENYPVADAYQSGRLRVDGLRTVFEFMNSSAVLTALNTVTDRPIDFCDMQVTKYGPGHVLTSHDDGVEGKNRQFAYVLGMTRDWSPVWGGQLQFLTDDGQVEQSFVPAFNTLSIFAVPCLHHVSQVASFAPRPRLSLTGWFRTKDA
ncbi:MAG: 2OG-Fe(II) oxygenase [Ponticaulis sp.]|nr:2OG-Fe(II) oxygenase [Ponticaulis sp.]|tara:strand:+ start:45018 stop:45773 length:756 start_codon:yes stop_codon:yes gene_type:complete